MTLDFIPLNISKDVLTKGAKYLIKTNEKQVWRSLDTWEKAQKEGSKTQVAAWSSFPQFREQVFGFYGQTYDHMKVWYEMLNTEVDSRVLWRIGGDNTLILSPRESAKSTVLAQWVAWVIGVHTSPWVRLAIKILGISYNQETALPRSRQIQAILRTKEYQEVFPWVRPSTSKWSETEWLIDLAWAGLPSTSEQYTYVCGGLTSGINSRRAHLAFMDDLIKSPDAIAAESIRNLMVSTWENVIQFCLFDGARAVCLGTRMSGNDIYCTEFIPQKGWKVIEQSALLEREDGTEYSYWEPADEKSPGTPLKRLQEERELKPIPFSFQRQNKLIRIKEQSISPELIIRGILPAQFDKLVLGADLSAGLKQSNDYSAFVLGGIVRKGDTVEYWVIDAWEERIMGNTAKLDAILEIWDMWSHLLPQIQQYNATEQQWEYIPATGLLLWFDANAYGLSFKGDYEDHIIKRKNILNWRIEAVSASRRGDKIQRLRNHTGLFEHKLIKFNIYGRTMPDGRKPLGRLITQITDPNQLNNDDLADGFELCASGLRSLYPLTKGNY